MSGISPFRRLVVRIARRMEAWAVKAPSMTAFDSFKQLELTAELQRKQDRRERAEMRAEAKSMRGTMGKLESRIAKLEAGK